jgi:ubiquinone/menaquinone biosynthesis C-methylase UbiE
MVDKIRKTVMTEAVKKTQEMLAKHHRDGAAFAQMMKETFTSRFNDTFWAFWEENIMPHLVADATVLDLGTGPGLFLRALVQRYPEMTAYGVECAPYMLDAVESLPNNAKIITADLHDPHLPLPEASVDAAVASVVLHEMHQPVKTLLEIQRCLKPGGVFYILDWVRAPLEMYLHNSDVKVFDRGTSAEALEDLFVHFIEHNRFSREDLEFMLANTGFDIVQSTPLLEGRQARILAQKRK